MQARMDGHRRYSATLQRCRAIERHVASLRGELEWLAGGEGDRQRVDRALCALREQIRLAELLADDFEVVARTLEPIAA